MMKRSYTIRLLLKSGEQKTVNIVEEDQIKALKRAVNMAGSEPLYVEVLGETLIPGIV